MSPQILASIHGEFSSDKCPTIQKVYPFLEKLQSEWQQLLENLDYEPIHNALKAGLENLEKWYCSTKATLIYFISHGKHSYNSK